MARALSLPTLAELEAAAATRRAQYTDDRRHLPPALKEYLQHLRMLATAARDWTVERNAEADGTDDAQRAHQPAVVLFPSAPTAPDDWWVLGTVKGLRSATGYPLDQRDFDGTTFGFNDGPGPHCVPRNIAERWLPSLPGRVFRSMPGDLLLALRNKLGRPRAGGLQGSGAGYSDVECNEDDVMNEASRIVRGCQNRSLLERWHKSASVGSDEASAKLAAIIAEQLDVLEAA
jgi:hypothetical protein